jgi:polysaccharide export outer membrane protein
MKPRLAALSLLIALGASGCAPSVMPPDVLQASLHEPYMLNAGDKLRVIVFGQDALSNVYAVDGAGRISMPLIGAIEARGMTTQTLEKAVENKLKAGYLREPKVSVEVDTYRPFFILGEVTNSGQYPFVNNMTIQTAVAIAGGYAPRAARTYAEVTRVVNGDLVTVNVPVTTPIRPGDTVVVKERYF